MLTKLYKGFYAGKVFPGVHLVRIDGAYMVVFGYGGVSHLINLYILAQNNLGA